MAQDMVWCGALFQDVIYFQICIICDSIYFNIRETNVSQLHAKYYLVQNYKHCERSKF
jgi:hypothetical protein